MDNAHRPLVTNFNSDQLLWGGCVCLLRQGQRCADDCGNDESPIHLCLLHTGLEYEVFDGPIRYEMFRFSRSDNEWLLTRIKSQITRARQLDRVPDPELL
jgi:hypothetical protein